MVGLGVVALPRGGRCVSVEDVMSARLPKRLASISNREARRGDSVVPGAEPALDGRDGRPSRSRTPPLIKERSAALFNCPRVNRIDDADSAPCARLFKLVFTTKPPLARLHGFQSCRSHRSIPRTESAADGRCCWMVGAGALPLACCWRAQALAVPQVDCVDDVFSGPTEARAGAGIHC